MKDLHSSKAFTLVELLVGLSMFSVFSLGLVAYMGQTFQRSNLENRTALAAQELYSAVELMSNELRMSSVVSPYLPGVNASLIDCSASLSVSNTSISFVVVHDDSSSSRGLKAYYVGYNYDPAEKKLLRGEIEKSSTTDCMLPAGDPTSTSVAKTIASRVVQLDRNSDGTDDPIFVATGSGVSINLAVEYESPSGEKVTQDVSTTVRIRS